MTKGNRAAAIILLTMAAIAAAVLTSQKTPSPSGSPALKTERQAIDVAVRMAGDPSGSPAPENFSSPGSVYAYLMFPDQTMGIHLIEGRWFRPTGELQEAATIKIDFSPLKTKAAYLWLQFKDESMVESLKIGNYADRSESDSGTWRLETFVDGMKVASTTFTVIVK